MLVYPVGSAYFSPPPPPCVQRGSKEMRVAIQGRASNVSADANDDAVVEIFWAVYLSARASKRVNELPW